MFWEEKIDRLKTHFDEKDFSVPFTDWSAILKKIESKFIIKSDSNHFFSNWSENIKKKQFIRQTSFDDLVGKLKQLAENEKFWVVIAMDNSPTSKLFVYDCRSNVIPELISIAPSDFFIVDKKYNWIVYLQRVENESINIFTSGENKLLF